MYLLILCSINLTKLKIEGKKKKKKKERRLLVPKTCIEKEREKVCSVIPKHFSPSSATRWSSINRICMDA